MDNTGSILMIAFAAVIAGYLGYRIRKERQSLRDRVAILKEKDTPLIDMLEELAGRPAKAAPAQ